MNTLAVAVWALAALQVPLAIVLCPRLAPTLAQWRRAARWAGRLGNLVLVLFTGMTVAFIWGLRTGGATLGVGLGWRFFLPVWLALLVWRIVLHWYGNRVEVAEAEKQGRVPVLEA